jgi:hypothetical protein
LKSAQPINLLGERPPTRDPFNTNRAKALYDVVSRLTFLCTDVDDPNRKPEPRVPSKSVEKRRLPEEGFDPCREDSERLAACTRRTAMHEASCFCPLSQLTCVSSRKERSPQGDRKACQVVKRSQQSRISIRLGVGIGVERNVRRSVLDQSLQGSKLVAG